MLPKPYLSAPVKHSNQGEVKGSILSKDPLIKPANSYQKKYLNFVLLNGKECSNCCTVQFSSVVQLCPTLRDCIDCSTPGLPAHNQHLEYTQAYIH